MMFSLILIKFVVLRVISQERQIVMLLAFGLAVKKARDRPRFQVSHELLTMLLLGSLDC